MRDWLKGYGLPVLLALLLHLAAVSALYGGFSPQPPKQRVIKPQIVQASLVTMEPQAQPKPAPQAAPKPAPKPAPEPKPKPKPAPEPEPEPKPKPKPEPERDLEAERRAREQAEARQQRLDELAQSSFDEALQDEAEALASQAAQSAADAAAQSYRVGIYQAVVANWSRPPSARNFMEAKLLVELVPTGDVVSVTLLESSGDAAFDRSAEAAVRKAGRFEVPKESEVFESYFRRFTLLFRPEDLLR